MRKVHLTSMQELTHFRIWAEPHSEFGPSWWSGPSVEWGATGTTRGRQGTL